jgi:hypothetical protein
MALKTFLIKEGSKPRKGVMRCSQYFLQRKVSNKGHLEGQRTVQIGAHTLRSLSPPPLLNKPTNAAAAATRRRPEQTKPNPTLPKSSSSSEQEWTAMGGGNGQKSKTARERNAEKNKAPKGKKQTNLPLPIGSPVSDLSRPIPHHQLPI